MRRWGRRRKLYYEVKNGVVQAKLLERHIVKEIIDRLWYQARIKVWIINQPVGGKTPQNVAGLPDLWGWISSMISPEILKSNGWQTPSNALPLLIEVKRPGGARRPAQERFIEEARLAGCAAFFAESWDDVVRELDRFGIKLKEAV